MAAEGVVSDLKRGSDKKMIKMKSPKVLWSYFLELEAYIRSNTDLDIFDLDRMTPETNMSGETSDITTLCNLGWYQWFYFKDTSVTFPGDNQVLERYCGPIIDVGPTLPAKIMVNNGQQIHRFTYRALTPDELVNSDEIKARD